MGLFSHRHSSVPAASRRALAQAVAACPLEALEARQLLSLTVDLRLAGGGKVAEVTEVDQVINMELWVTAEGSNGSGADDGFQMLIGSIKSGDGGSVLGDLEAILESQFTGMAAYEGDQVDLDGDGDLDVGSDDDSVPDGFFVARSGSMSYTGGTVSGSSNSFKIADVKFKVTDIGAAGDVKVNFIPRNGPAAVWAEDGSPKNNELSSAFGVGSPITLRVEGGSEIDASVTDGTLTVRGTDGDNIIKVTLSGVNLIAEVDGKTKSFDAATVNRIRVLGLDGNDNILIGSTVATRARLEGGDGNDTITGGSGRDTLYGQAGKDYLKGAKGNDLLDGGTGRDKMSGGSGTDIVSYKTRTAALRVSIDDVANDGEIDEADNVRLDVERVYGGSGADKMVGSSAGNYFRGYAGNDTLVGGAGNDTLDGGTGKDKLSGGDGDDRLFARDSAIDTLSGGSGTDKAEADKGDILKDIEKLLA